MIYYFLHPIQIDDDVRQFYFLQNNDTDDDDGIRFCFKNFKTTHP